MNIYQKLLAIQTDLQTVAKNLNVDTGNGRGYKAVSERDIIDAVKPLEAKYKIYSFPKTRRILREEMLETESSYKDRVTKKTTFYKLIETTYCFVNAEQPEEYIETTVCAEGIDSQDKGCGKAMTYADKYALMKVYKISTGEDPDQAASTEEHYSKAVPLAQQKANEANVAALRDLIAETKADEAQLLDFYDAGRLEDLTLGQWKQAMEILTKRKMGK